jgi:hypothetical protein
MSDSTRPDPLLSDDEDDAPARPGTDDAGAGTWRRFENLVPDVVKRGLISGLGALFMTEEGVRSALGDLKLPKEAVTFLVAQAERSKRELTQTLAREVRAFLGSVDVSGVLQRALAGMTVEFKTQVRFIPREGGLEPRVELSEIERVVKQPGPRPRKTRGATGRRRTAPPKPSPPSEEVES